MEKFRKFLYYSSTIPLQKTPKPQKTSSRARGFVCAVCGASFVRRYHLLRHDEASHQPPLPCGRCSSLLGTREHLVRHVAKFCKGARPQESAPAAASVGGATVDAGLEEGAPIPANQAEVVVPSVSSVGTVVFESYAAEFAAFVQEFAYPGPLLGRSSPAPLSSASGGRETVDAGPTEGAPIPAEEVEVAAPSVPVHVDSMPVHRHHTQNRFE